MSFVQSNGHIFQNFVNNFLMFQQEVPIEKSWFNAILETLGPEGFFNICKQIDFKLRHEIALNPKLENLWSFSNYSNINEIKMVIIGSYPSQIFEQTGLAFSTESGSAFSCWTLNTFFNELARDSNINNCINFSLPNHNTLSGWAVQGVLLLNSYLMVRYHGNFRAQIDQWITITNSIIKWISLNNENVVFVLLGRHAKKKARFIDQQRHYLFGDYGIYGSNLFSLAHQYFINNNIMPIDFNFLPNWKFLKPPANKFSYFRNLYIFRQNLAMGNSWLEALIDILGFVKLYNTCEQISNQLEEEYSLYMINSTYEKIWSFANYFPIHQTKLVIVGNEPATLDQLRQEGLAFSTGDIISPSLKAIYQELAQDIGEFQIPNHAYLNGWAAERVLLLNCCLTVRCGNFNQNRGSHRHIRWDILTDAWVQWISLHLNNVVFILFGEVALKKKRLIDHNKHQVYDFFHPSGSEFYPRFIRNEKDIRGSGVFSNANSYLVRNGISPINFGNLPYPTI